MTSLAISTIEEEKTEIHRVNVIHSLLSQIESARLQINSQAVHTAHVETILVSSFGEIPVLSIAIGVNGKSKADSQFFSLDPYRLAAALTFINQYVTVSPSSSAKEGTLLGVKH